jgi:Possible hemagglutinin (DUF637).
LEREQVAAVFGEIGFELVGKLIHDKVNNGEWKSDDPRAIALHALIGGIMAEFNGGNFGEGMTVAAINKLLITKLSELEDEKGNKLIDGTELRWISGLLGLALDGEEGGAIADSATRNNLNGPDDHILDEERVTKIAERAFSPERIAE